MFTKQEFLVYVKEKYPQYLKTSSYFLIMLLIDKIRFYNQSSFPIENLPKRNYGTLTFGTQVYYYQ